MTDTYLPVACALHDQFEIAIMHKSQLSIKWLDENGATYTDKVLPKDIHVKDRQEFLIAVTQANKVLTIRLDKITLLDK